MMRRPAFHTAAASAIILTASMLAACSRPDPQADLQMGKLLLSQNAANAPQARAYLEAAAQAGSPAAAYHLGLLLRRGAPGVRRDLPQARQWLQTAAVAHLPDAQFMLAQMLRQGEGGPVDTAGARRLLEEAGEHDQPEANLELAMAYQRGDLGVRPDAQQAERYLMEAQHSLKDRPPAP
jgi:TPR repeat protein